jgi:hypothetical protein
MNKWYNTELSRQDAERLSYYLTKNSIKFETSGAYNLTHFEILATPKQAEMINTWIDDQL